MHVLQKHKGKNVILRPEDYIYVIYECLLRCRKSCRLRWPCYLSPNIRRGNFTLDEDDLIIRLPKLLGNRWSLIAGRLPGRTANDVQNHWNTHLRKRLAVREGSMDNKGKASRTIANASAVIFRPRARRHETSYAQNISTNDHNITGSSSTTLSMAHADHDMQWFSNFFADEEMSEGASWTFIDSAADMTASLLAEEISGIEDSSTDISIDILRHQKMVFLFTSVFRRPTSS